MKLLVLGIVRPQQYERTGFDATAFLSELVRRKEEFEHVASV
jgi:hypothetical protein